MSFNFSAYDYNEEPQENLDSVITDQEQPKPKTKPILQLKDTESKGTFNFSAYDETPVQEKRKSKNPFEAPPVSNEQYNKMSISEKLQYAEQLEKEQKYEASKAFTKNLASEASFGFSEDSPSWKPEEGEDPVAGFAGKVVGEFPVIMGASKLVGLGSKEISKSVTKDVIEKIPKILKPLKNFLHAFATGSTVESGKQTANAIRGEEVNVSEIPTRGLEFAAFDTFIRGLGELGKKFLKISPSNQAKILEEGIIPSDLPKSQYETAEEVLRVIREQQPKRNFPRPEGPPPPDNPPPPPGGSPPPSGGRPAPRRNVRVSRNGKDLGLRPTSADQTPQLQDQVGDIFSRERFYNTTQGGQAFKNEIMEIDNDVYQGVNELYNISRNANTQVNSVQPELVAKLEEIIGPLSQIPEPSNIQKRVLTASRNILNRLVEFEDVLDEAGNVIDREIIEYLPINNQTLIDQIQSLRQIIDFDFHHGDAKNIFRPLINDLQDAAIRSAEEMGHPEAAEALNNARMAYRSWVEAFDNDYIRPFRDTSNQDFSKLYKSAMDFDEANMVRKILGLSDNGQRLAAASTREIVEKQLSKFFENPRSVSPREFNTILRELEAVITPEQAQQIRDQFTNAQQRPPFRAKTPQKKLTNDEKIAARYEGKEPEDIQHMMNRRSGIKQLREDLNTPQKKAIFERLKQQKIRSILREGNIDKDFTGDDLYKFLNKEHNYELLSEMLGESETEVLRQSAKEIGKEQVKSELRNKGIKSVTNKVVAYKTLELILNLL